MKGISFLCFESVEIRTEMLLSGVRVACSRVRRLQDNGVEYSIRDL